MLCECRAIIIDVSHSDNHSFISAELRDTRVTRLDNYYQRVIYHSTCISVQIPSYGNKALERVGAHDKAHDITVKIDTVYAFNKLLATGKNLGP